MKDCHSLFLVEGPLCLNLLVEFIAIKKFKILR